MHHVVEVVVSYDVYVPRGVVKNMCQRGNCRYYTLLPVRTCRLMVGQFERVALFSETVVYIVVIGTVVEV